MRALAPLFLFVALALATSAAQPEPRKSKDAAAVEAAQEWCRTSNGFGAAIVITSDPEWKRKWGAPASKLPKIEQASSLRVGQKVWALIFLSNPLVDLAGNVDVTCDLRMVRPNGKVTEKHDLRVLRKKTVPVPRTYMSEFVLTMVGEENDPLGEWVVECVFRDKIRGVTVPVTNRYRLMQRQ